MISTWSFPTRILQGEGAVRMLGAEAASLRGKRALIVTDAGVRAAGLLEPAVASLSAAGIHVDVFDGISSNPLETEVLAGASAFRDAGSEIVVGIGGGSPLDVSKLVRLLATHRPPLAQYDDAANGSALVTGELPPLITIPTTAGTGSEVGRSAVVTLQATNKKTVIFSPRLIANAAILDPELTKSMPPHITAATGMDALTHCFEAFCARGHHPMADAIALAGLELAARHLERAVRDGNDMEARAAMLEASMMGAVAFQKGLGACHSMAHPLSTEFGLHHGLANALCLPSVIEFNRAVAQARIARTARALGIREGDAETLAFESAGAVRNLRQKIGLPERLADVGVPEDALPRLAELAVQDPCHAGNPRPCTTEDFLTLYKSAY
jgi:4-hydroxybutyrate dehydrogenase